MVWGPHHPPSCQIMKFLEQPWLQFSLTFPLNRATRLMASLPLPWLSRCLLTALLNYLALYPWAWFYTWQVEGIFLQIMAALVCHLSYLALLKAICGPWGIRRWVTLLSLGTGACSALSQHFPPSHQLTLPPLPPPWLCLSFTGYVYLAKSSSSNLMSPAKKTSPNNPPPNQKRNPIVSSFI